MSCGEGESTGRVGGSGREDPDESTSLAAHFHRIYEELMKAIQSPETNGTLEEQDAQLRYLQMELEKLTTAVSALDMFSGNEGVAELPPLHLQFLALPYLLGTIWSLKDVASGRKEAISMAQLYFTDFLNRLLALGLIPSPPPVLATLASHAEGENGDAAGSSHPPPLVLSAEEKRRLKIAKFRETKELEQKVDMLQTKNTRWVEDEEVVGEVWGLLLRKYGLDAENQLESIVKETELLRFGEAQAEGRAGPLAPPPKLLNPPPFSLFMLTKSDLQKKVYGAGYPSLPIMTVDELYEQRRRDGTWGPPPSSHTQVGVAEEEDASAEREAAEDSEDATARLAQLALDEYKDEHRRGWGNRMNRS